MNKYEYLTGEDLGYKPGVVEQAKFEYTLLVKVFNKGLEIEDKKRTFQETKKQDKQLKIKEKIIANTH